MRLKVIRFKFILIIVSLLGSISSANVNVYEFNSEVDEMRFQSLIRELRCPKCQNQNIADSNAPLSRDLKDRTYEMILDGRADSEIIGFMVERYGDFVTYNPPVKKITWVLWFGPAGLLVFVIMIVMVTRLTRNPNNKNGVTPLSEADKATLMKILEKEDKL